MHICKHTHTRRYPHHVHNHTHTQIHTHKRIRKNTHVHTCTHMHAQMHAYSRTAHECACLLACMCVGREQHRHAPEPGGLGRAVQADRDAAAGGHGVQLRWGAAVCGCVGRGCHLLWLPKVPQRPTRRGAPVLQPESNGEATAQEDGACHIQPRPEPGVWDG